MKLLKNKIKQILQFDGKVKNEVDKVVRNQNFIPISETHPRDIFIAGYPKSGNTWMQNLIAGVQFGIDTSLLPDSLTQELVPDVHGRIYYKRFTDIVFFKSHDLPKENMKRVIHLVRDGRDAIASYYAMNKALGKTTSLENMIVDGKDIYPSKWHEHTRAWLENPFNAEILIIKYEDLVQNPFDQIKKILAFAELERSDEIINNAIQGNSFAEMKRKEAAFGWNNKNWDPKQDFIRKGKIGTYKSEIPANLVSIFEAESNKELLYFDYL